MSSDTLRVKLLALVCWSTLCWAAPTCATNLEERIETLNARIGELSVQIRRANTSQERDKAAELGEQRELLLQELRRLRNQAKEAKQQAAEVAERAALERAWAKYPPEKQLCAAIHYGRLDLVQKVVSSGAMDLLKPNRYCFFPLAEAAALGYRNIAEYLLEHKSPLVMRAPPDFTIPISALDAAAANREDRTAMLELLKKHGASLTASQNSTPPDTAAGKADADPRKIHLPYGSSLLKALEEGHLKNVRWLLKEGANPNDSLQGRTALMFAVDSNELDKVSTLLNAGADINQRGPEYLSVLTYAEQRQSRVSGRKKAEMDEIIAYLKARGATKSEQELATAGAGQNS